MMKNTLLQFTRAALFLSVVGTMGVGSTPALAAAPMVKTSAPAYHRLMLGAFEVTALSDGTIKLPVDKILMEPVEKTTAALSKSFLQAPLETSVNVYLINTGSKLILIDAGTGSLFGPSLGKLITNLKASGYEPGQIDDIYLTHLHPDHAGGLMLNNEIVFANANIHVEQAEADYWLSQKNMEQAPADAKGFFQGAMASVNPYKTANKLQTFARDGELLPGLTAYSTHGHTEGHTSYLIESQGQKLLLAGDLIHVAAVQLDKPEVTVTFDSHAKEAAAMRQKIFTQAAKDGTLIGASHIQFPGLGHLKKTGSSYQWIPVNFTQMQ
ncbi:MBL fold metallo-hydrolase [Undibacterium sp. Di26W]|uniref:MBL fold metallo-hydrolase n=1 Tax=Undibacterium sp. Di26W TaxID=3413035 RepID=UPI003BF38B4E